MAKEKTSSTQEPYEPVSNQEHFGKATSATQPTVLPKSNLASKAIESATLPKDKEQETTLEDIQNEIITARTAVVSGVSEVKTAVDNLKGHIGQGSQSATQVNYADWSKPAASNTHEQIGSAIEIDKRVTQLVQSGKFDEKQANQIRQQAADMATHYGKSSVEVLDLMVNALNGGLTLDKENAVDTLARHTQFSLQYDRASDQLTADQSSNNLLELYLKTDFGENLSADEKVSKAAEFSNVIHHVRREQQVNEQSLINLITQNSSRVVGDSFNKEELAAFAGTLLSKNASEAMASTTLKSIHSTLTAGKALDETKQNAFSQLGFEEMPTQMDQATLVKVFEAIALQDKDAQDDYLEKLFGKESVEVLLPILSDPNSIKAGFDHIADSSKYQGNIEQKSANAADDPYQRINSALTAVNELGNTIGTALLPPIAALADGIVWLTNAIRTCVEQFRTALGGGAVAGVIVAATTWYAASRALKAGTRVLGKLPGRLLDKITSPIRTVLGLKNNGQAGSGLSLTHTNKEIRYATIALKRFSRQLDRATLSAGGSLPDYGSSDNQKNKKGDKGSQGAKKTSASKNSFGKMAINHVKAGAKFAFWTSLISTVLFNANNANAAEQLSSLPTDKTDTTDRSNNLLSSDATVSTKTSTETSAAETSEKTADSHTSNLTALSEENTTPSTTENSSSITDWLMPIGGLAATFIRPLNTAMNTVRLAKAAATGDKENVATLAGDVAGGAAGTAIGATIGTFLLPGIGTAVGGLLGGAIGSFAGSKSASWISSKASSFFSSENSEEKHKASQKSQIPYEEQQDSGKALESANQAKSGKGSWLRRGLGALDIGIAALPFLGLLSGSSEKTEQGQSEQGWLSYLFSGPDNETGSALNQADQQVKQELQQANRQTTQQDLSQLHSESSAQNSGQQNQQITITPNITINAAPGSNEELIAENVIQKLGQSIQQSFSSYQSNLDGRMDNNIGLTA